MAAGGDEGDGPDLVGLDDEEAEHGADNEAHDSAADGGGAEADVTALGQRRHEKGRKLHESRPFCPALGSHVC